MSLAVSLPAPRSRDRSYLFGPVIDLLCLGGGSLIAIGLIAMMRHAQTAPPRDLFVAMIAPATLLNHPHFMHSYQLFYRGFAHKIRRSPAADPLRVRYIMAGIAVPVLLLLLLGLAVALPSEALVSVIGSAFVLLTGWHYVKQGYGMLMTDATLNHAFLTQGEKRLLLLNCYVVWASYACLFAAGYGPGASNGQGIQAMRLSPRLAELSLGFAAILLAAIVVMLARKALAGGKLPVLGIGIYFITVYVWLFLLLDPWFLLVIPAFHSLQYLTVVWRVQLNRLKAEASPRLNRERLLAFSGFVGWGVLLGILAFLMIPMLLDATIGTHAAIGGGGFFLFAFAAFINIHHYFMDNVMWRRENADVRRYLFASV